MPPRGASDASEQEELLGSVVRNADALMRILTTVLEISRSEARTGRNQFAWFDVGELAAELAEMYDPLAEERGASLRFQPPASPLRLFGHRQLLAQAVSNLIENAIRYGWAGGEIAIGVEARGDHVRIEVGDRGPGIPSDRRDEARRRFGGSIRAGRTKAPGSASRSPKRSPICTAASFCSRTMGRDC